MKLLLANQATAAKRRVYFLVVDGTDGMTPRLDQAGGQPQISTDGGAWTNTGISILVSMGSGYYYAELTQAAVATVGTVISTRFKSAATAESPGTTMQIVAFDPDAIVGLGLTNLDATVSSRSTLTQAQILSDATPFQGGRVDAAISSRATQAQILSDVTPFQGGMIDAAISSRAAPGAAMTLAAGAIDAGQIAAGAIGATQAPLLANLDATVSSRAAPGAAMNLAANALTGAAIDATGSAKIADGVWDEQLSGHGSAGSAGDAQGHCDQPISSRAIAGDPMALSPNAVDASALADSAVAKIDAELSAAHGSGSWHSSTDPAAIADAVWDEILAGHATPGSAGAAEARLDTEVSSRAAPADVRVQAWMGFYPEGSVVQLMLLLSDGNSSQYPQATIYSILTGLPEATVNLSSIGQGRYTGNWTPATVGPYEVIYIVYSDSGHTHENPAYSRVDEVWRTDYALPGDAMDLVPAAVEAIDVALSAEHGDGSWEGSSASAVATAVWNEALPGSYSVGSAGKIVGDDLDAKVSTRATQAQILSDATPFPGARIDAAVSSRAAPGAAMDLITDAVDANSLATSAVSEIDSALSAVHGSGSWGGGGSTPEEIADAVWDEPVADHVDAGSTGKKLQDPKTVVMVDPSIGVIT